MRPHTPTLNISHAMPGTIGPTSPPDTPITASPVLNRTLASNGRPPPPAKARNKKPQQSNIRPLGGTQFSYNPTPRPEEISPQLSHSSDEEDSGSSISPPQSPVPDIVPGLQQHILAAAIHIDEADFAIESLSDCSLGSDDENVPVLRPYDVEYPDSDRSQSRSRPPPDMDPEVMTGVQNLNPFEDTDGDIDPDEEFERQRLHNRQERRLRRMKSGSISKRTVSERDSDSDKEDVLPYYDGNEPGPNFRRMRRKVGDRTSIQLNGPLPEPIEELREPLSENEIILDDAEVFAKELPYWTLMDVDSE
ncbi:hypothetical protein F5X99DRAFT_67182 [Biscogniauxia marginata]|nr:hypothetical protein F5X99DRAFT_67182 [Biscogniauxia marginata]